MQLYAYNTEVVFRDTCIHGTDKKKQTYIYIEAH